MRRARTADLRSVEALDLLGSPFDPLAHTVDVRRIDSNRTVGRYNVSSAAVFIWRLKSYSVTQTPAYCAEEAGPECYTFSVLGQDTPLFIKPETQTEQTFIAEELSVPAAIRRFAFHHHLNSFYGPAKSLAIWADGWPGAGSDSLIPVSAIIPSDLSLWQYTPPAQQIAVDPRLGRIAFPPGQLPKKGVRVTYHYGFSADIGGGEYKRILFDPVSRKPGEPMLYQVRKIPQAGGGQAFQKIADALAQWQKDNPLDAVIELADSTAYIEQIAITLGEGQTLQLRASNEKRPVIRMLDWQTDRPDALSVTMSRGQPLHSRRQLSSPAALSR